MSEILIKIENVSKQYRLGAIGGGTLRGDLQSRWARLRHKEDPNSKIGEDPYKKNEKFMALDGINLEIHKGETLGIVGRNGAGKSTLLKLLSRITAPTSGMIYIKGRVSSMLEVGTGFHPELSGRDNIYMNGAILGMKRGEVTKKMDEIIEFSECEKFIDTPVKRYSSGMFVKLAFAVAAHLNSDIMLMDEVLAVGDMAFQKKCIDKMVSVAADEGKTIIYISHNMNTVRRLCGRGVVLDKGKVIYDGETEKAISIYLNKNAQTYELYYNFADKKRASFLTGKAVLAELELKNGIVIRDRIILRLSLKLNEEMKDTAVRFVFHNYNNEPVATAVCPSFGGGKAGDTIDRELIVEVGCLAQGSYSVLAAVCETTKIGAVTDADAIWPAFSFKKETESSIEWKARLYGDVKLPDIELMTDTNLFV